MESLLLTYETIPSLLPHESLSAADQEEFDSYLTGCDCSDICTPPDTENDGNSKQPFSSNCSCHARMPLAYDSDGRLREEYFDKKAIPPPVVECGALCSCRTGCCNRQVGRGLRDGSSLKVISTPGKGYGLITLRDIPARTFVCEYAGEVISLSEAAKRTKAYPADTYIFVIQERSGADGPLMRTCIDARHKADLGRFINHSCRPNLRMIPVRVDINIPRLAFFTARDIASREELTTDYGQYDTLGGSEESFTPGVVPCRCGIDNCRKFLPCQIDAFAT